jgi:hypothetical protein
MNPLRSLLLSKSSSFSRRHIASHRIPLHCSRPSCATSSSQVQLCAHHPQQYHITFAAKSRRQRPQPTGTTHRIKDIFAPNPGCRLVFRPADPISFAQSLEDLLHTIIHSLTSFIHYFSPFPSPRPSRFSTNPRSLALVLQSTHHLHVLYSTTYIDSRSSIPSSSPFPFPSCRAADFASSIAISKRSSSGFGKSTGTNLKSSLEACDNKKKNEHRTPRAQSIYPPTIFFNLPLRNVWTVLTLQLTCL